MPNIQGQKKWSEIRLLETHELARGGINGNLNEQAIALADRTEFLNQEKANKSEIVQGVFEFATYAEFNAAKANLPLNCTVVIGEENTTGSGSWGIGNNAWNGSILRKSSFDPVSKINAELNINPKFKTGIMSVSNPPNLNDILTAGEYVNTGGGASASAALNYPEPYAGVLEVERAPGSSFISQVYMTVYGTVYYRRYNGTSWTPWDYTGKAYPDSNPNFNSKLIPNGTSLDTFTVEGFYFKNGSPDITDEQNYPVKLAGVLRVSGNKATSIVQTYIPYSTADVYTRGNAGSGWTAWKQQETTTGSQTKVDAAIKKNVSSFQWFMTANNTQPIYDVATKTLSWSAPIVAPSRNHSANRIYIPAGSVVCDTTATGAPNGVLYLDLDKVPSTGTLTVEDIALCLKFASYPTYRGEPNFVPIAKQDRTKNAGSALVAVNGFVPIKNSFEAAGLDSSLILEWQKVASTTSIIFNKDTKTLTIAGYILAPYNNAAGRIRIQDISIPFTENFQVAYLDLTALGSVTDINATNKDQFIKVATYSSASTGYRAKSGQVALAKYYSGDNVVTPAAGFLPISGGGNSSPNTASNTDYIEFDKTENLLQVYMRSVNGTMFRVGLQHQIVSASELSNGQSNADLWRIYRLFECDPETRSGVLELVNSGEWECAITHSEATQAEGVAKDHVGGYHGDELLTNAKFFIDGVLKPQEFTVSDVKKAKKIEFIQHSVIYFQNTMRPLCDHIKHITFTKDGVHLKQSLNFKYEAVDMSTAWITMLPVLRMSGSVQVTDTSARSNDVYLQEDDNTLEGFTRRYTPVRDGDVIKQWGKVSGYSFETTLIKTPNVHPNQNVFITNGGGYNKIYVSATGGENTSPFMVQKDTVWNIETMYQFNKVI